MNGAFYVGAVGLETQQRALDIVANNISNMNTSAFKRSQVRFSEVIASRADPAVQSADLAQQPAMVSSSAVDQMMMIEQQGEMLVTGQSKDIAIDGPGFIELMGPGGQTYLWRGGALKVNDEGLLATTKGLVLRANISVPRDATDIQISGEGTVSVLMAGEAEPIEAGQIDIVRLEDADTVDRLDGGIYRLHDGARVSEARAGEDGAGILVQGSVERSNVDLTEEMVALMLVQRAYSANAQIMQAADRMMGIANGLRQ